MTRILAIGPYSALHGEGRMFHLTVDHLASRYDVQCVDSYLCRSRMSRALNTAYYLILNLDASYSKVYLSTSRNKFSLVIVLLALLIASTRSTAEIFFHIHGIELKRNTTGILGSLVKRLYLLVVDVTIIPNSSIDDYSRLSANMNIQSVVNPYLGNVTSLRDTNVAELHRAFIFVSFPSRNKGLKELLSLPLIKSYPIKVVGWCPEDFKEIYGSEPDHGQVSFLGKCSPETTLNYLKASRGLLAFSKEEAMPLTLIEALMLGVPVYTNDCPGYRFFQENFETVAQIGQTTTELLEFSKKEVTRSRERAQELFSEKSYFESIESVLFET